MKKTIPKCRRCHVNMKPGTALENGVSGTPDFSGDKDACTLYLDPAKVSVVNCWKCPKCGHSISKA